MVSVLVAVLSSKIAVENNVIQKVFCKTIYRVSVTLDSVVATAPNLFK